MNNGNYHEIEVYKQIPEEFAKREMFDVVNLLPFLRKPTVVQHQGDGSLDFSVWLVTLQHANESSGLYIFADMWKKLLENNTRYPFQLNFMIVNGYAASQGTSKSNQVFSQRFADNQADFNRCWYLENQFPVEVPRLQRKQIQELTDIILASDPRYLLDIHNTTGHNKPLGFRVNERQKNSLLYSMVDDIIYQPGTWAGSFLQFFHQFYTTFTIECGKTGTLAAFNAGRKMIDTFLTLNSSRETPVNEYKDLKQIVISEEVDFTFYNPAVSLDKNENIFFVRRDIETMNQQNLMEFGLIGIYAGKGMPFKVFFSQDGKKEDVAEQYFRKESDGRIFATKECYGQLFSTNKQNVRDSELGYISDRINQKSV